MTIEEQMESLAQARKVYGNRNQIMVCIEELNELACVLAKYPRYTDEETARKELHTRVLDEFADVTIILNHVQEIMGLTDEEVCERRNRKISRLQRWLSNSSSMQETVDDRAVDECGGCSHSGEEDHSTCTACNMAEATEGIKPFYRKEG